MFQIRYLKICKEDFDRFVDAGVVVGVVVVRLAPIDVVVSVTVDIVVVNCRYKHHHAFGV